MPVTGKMYAVEKALFISAVILQTDAFTFSAADLFFCVQMFPCGRKFTDIIAYFLIKIMRLILIRAFNLQAFKLFCGNADLIAYAVMLDLL